MQVNYPPSLVSVVAESGTQFIERPALAHGMDLGGETLSYGQLWDHVNRGGQFLRKADLKPGARILLLLESSPMWAPAFFSILHAGHVVVPVTPDAPASALASITQHAEVSAVILSENTEALGAELSEVRPIKVRELFTSSSVTDDYPGETTSELAMLAFTSGSTRQPLAVQLTHANLLADLKALLQVRRAGPHDVFLSMLPPAHLFEFMGGLLGPLACGSKIVYPGLPLPNRLVESLRRDHITHACCVPGLLNALYEEILDELAASGIIASERRTQSVIQTAQRIASELEPASLNNIVTGIRSRMGHSFKTLVLGGAALDPAWIRILTALGIRAEIGYGLTEASPIVTLDLGEKCPPGSVGRPLPGMEIRIDDSGEILVRGPNITTGYYRNNEATRAALSEGWLRTGDCGTLDGDGFLFITGRLKESMVTSTGDTIYPEEVEPYYESPLFAEWCVAGRPGPDGNDLPTLFVVPATLNPNPQAITDAFQQLRATAPARFRLDKVVCLQDRLPRTALGKPRRRAVLAGWQRQNKGEQHA